MVLNETGPDVVTVQNIAHSDLRSPLPIDRFEACLNGAAYAPHRHDTYTIGITLEGVQSFDYRGDTRHALPRDIFVLHPDELHDGRAGTETGFRYRAFHLRPAVVQDILGGANLPYISDGLCDHPALKRAVLDLLDDSIDPLGAETSLVELVDALSLASNMRAVSKRPDYRAAQVARNLIEDRLEEGVSLEELSTAADADRFALARSFRALFGTSPHRYLTQRRLDRACTLMAGGESCAQAALMCGFSDQSHFMRHFKKTHGMTPRRWMTLRTNVQ